MRQIGFPFLWILVLIMPWEDIFVIPGLASVSIVLGAVTFLLGLVGILFQAG